MLRLDHVVYAVPDLDDAAVRVREKFGLDSTEGGRHERWGTANRIVPLGDQYLELVAAVDEPMAVETAFGRGVLERAAGGGGWFTIEDPPGRPDRPLEDGWARRPAARGLDAVLPHLGHLRRAAPRARSSRARRTRNRSRVGRGARRRRATPQ